MADEPVLPPLMQALRAEAMSVAEKPWSELLLSPKRFLAALNEIEARIAEQGEEIAGVRNILREMAVYHGSVHDEDCPCDDTCRCSLRSFNDRVNAACREA